MKIDEVFLLWNEDCKIDQSELATESLKIPYLHNKYYKLLINERLRLKIFQTQYNKLLKLYQEYFLGQLSEDELRDFGLTPYPLRILKQDVEQYINSEQKIIDQQLKLSQQKETVELLESIIKVLNTRTFHIKNAIDFLKFQNGIN